MSAPAIGGKVLDASAVVAIVLSRLSALTWVDIARTSGIMLVLPSLALSEARALYPGSGPALAVLLQHPWVVLDELGDKLDGQLSDADDGQDAAAAVREVLERASAADTSGDAGVEVVDVLAAHVVHAASSRGWPVLTTDPARLRRLDPGVEVELL